MHFLLSQCFLFCQELVSLFSQHIHMPQSIIQDAFFSSSESLSKALLSTSKA